MWSVITAAFLVGVASTPHCAAMCGPLASYAGCGRGTGRAYHLARLGVLVLFGALAGALGELVVIRLDAGVAQNVLSVMLGLGLATSAWRIWRDIARQQSGQAPLVKLRKKGDPSPSAFRRALWVGAGTPLLPCGALWGALMIAVGTAKVHAGALAMVAFWIPTAIAAQMAAQAATAMTRLGVGGRRAFALVLALGAFVTMLRPLDAFRETVSCAIQ